MANTDPSNKGIAEAFKSFPFATDQEYQVSDPDSFRCAVPPLTVSVLCILSGGLADHTGEQHLQR